MKRIQKYIKDKHQINIREVKSTNKLINFTNAVLVRRKVNKKESTRRGTLSGILDAFAQVFFFIPKYRGKSQVLITDH